MRAVYIENFKFSKETVLKGDTAHHLIKVLRLKVGTDILILDGNGSVSNVCISQINKGEVFCEGILTRLEERKSHIDLAVGLVKKDALELILKQACELGFRRIFLLETEYSQRYKLNNERVKKLLVSGIEQSNNPYLPIITKVPLSKLDISEYENIFLFSSQRKGEKFVLHQKDSHLIVIGPEGGLSADEENNLKTDKTKIIKLDTYILRSPTAVSAAIGFIHGKLE